MIMAQNSVWKKASSVILFDSQFNRALMLRRGPEARFMPNSFVFPGGMVDDVDYMFPRQKTNCNNLDSDENYALRVCALRELFEESGLLPVTDRNCREYSILNSCGDTQLADWRKRIMNEPSLFSQMFSKNNLNLDIGSLKPWANWLTPLFGRPALRYDTTFFLFLLNSISLARIEHCAAEMTEAIWEEPSEIIEKSSKSEISLPPPQYYELLRLSQMFQEEADAVFTVKKCQKRITPQIFRVAGRPELNVHILPGDHMYNDANPDFTPPVENGISKELLPPYDYDDESKPIHRLIFESNPPHLQYHKLKLYLHM